MKLISPLRAVLQEEKKIYMYLPVIDTVMLVGTTMLY